MKDFNDLHQEQGPEAVATAISNAEKPKPAKVDKPKAKKKPKPSNGGLALERAEPWPELVDGHELLTDLATTFEKYLVLSAYQAEALALWVVFSYAIDAANIAPKLLIYSPEKRCGKTTLLDVLIGLVAKPLPASNISAAAIFRTIEACQPSLIIDEADTFLKADSEMTGIINSGHRKSAAFTIRLVGDNHEPRQFSTWAPTVIAMIGKPKDTIVDRSILIQMRRKRPDETVSRFIPHRAESHLKQLASKAARWTDDNFEKLLDADPYTPEDLNDRAADNWRPLLAIADLIGGEYPEAARKAASALALSDDEDEGSPGEMLLNDIAQIFEEQDTEKLSTGDLLDYLNTLEDRPWGEWNRGKELTARQLSNKLRPFDIRPGDIRDSWGKRCKGYKKEDFHDAFKRYVSPPSPVPAAQPCQPAENLAFSGTDKVRQENPAAQPYQAEEDWRDAEAF